MVFNRQKRLENCLKTGHNFLAKICFKIKKFKSQLIFYAFLKIAKEISLQKSKKMFQQHGVIILPFVYVLYNELFPQTFYVWNKNKFQMFPPVTVIHSLYPDHNIIFFFILKGFLLLKVSLVGELFSSSSTDEILEVL